MTLFMTWHFTSGPSISTKDSWLCGDSVDFLNFFIFILNLQRIQTQLSNR